MKKDLETLSMKSAASLASRQSEEEVTRMKDYIKTLETEYKQRRETSESLIERLKEFTCMTLRL